MKKTYHGYDVSTKQGQMDLAYRGLIDPNLRSTNTGKPVATQEDIELLTDKGLAWLQENQYDGVIDRLKTSGLIK